MPISTAASVGVAENIRRIWHNQARIARLFMNDKRFRVPVTIIWVTAFGSSLASPIGTFYNLYLGSTEMDLGWLGFITSLGTAICAPFFGYVLDRFGSTEAICLTSLSCSVGCLIRLTAVNTTSLYVGAVVLGLGAENLGMVVLAHIARNTDENERANVISACLFQNTVLRLLGKTLYTPWNFFLEYHVGIRDRLTRMRFHEGQCTVLCFYGIARLVSNWSELNSAIESGRKKKEMVTIETTPTIDERRSEGAQWMKFGFFALLLILQSITISFCNILWPLYVKDRFGWNSEGYAIVLLGASTCSSVAIAAAPNVARAIGQARGLIFTYIIAVVFALIAALLFHTEAIPHTLSLIGLVTMLSFLEPTITTCASMSTPPLLQGVSFGSLASLTAFGCMIGSPVATALYHISKEAPRSMIWSGGTLPTLCVAAVLIVSLAFVLVRKTLSYDFPIPPAKAIVSSTT